MISFSESVSIGVKSVYDVCSNWRGPRLVQSAFGIKGTPDYIEAR